MKIYNRKQYIDRRRALRGDMPKAELLLWNHLRSRKLDGYKFRRQHGIGNYIVDFYCSNLKLVIEIDGDSHFDEDGKQKDVIRDIFLWSQDLEVMRFTNLEIYHDLERVLEDIKAHCDGNLP
jgi:very-short-patch-repair endonuclease